MPATLLVIDDDDIDREFIARMISRQGYDIQLEQARDGVAGLQWLRGGDETSSRRADLVLLDLHMPRMDGQTFLRELRDDESLRDTLVVVLLTSPEYRKSIDPLGLRVDGYLVKPVQADDFASVLMRLNIRA